jgi:amino acid adenylation domain-containing protein
MISVLKSGAAFLPIDPSNPKERVDFILTDSSSALLVDLTLIEEFIQHSNSYKDDPISISIQPASLAYCIYTSGSTGLPKGVLIEQRSIVNTVNYQKRIFAFEEGMVHAQFASFSFDASLWEIWISLVTGGALHILSQDVRSDAERYVEYIERYLVNVATLPPSMLNVIDINRLGSLKSLLSTGEEPIAEPLLAFAGMGRCINGYGPTESSICATIYDILPGKIKVGDRIPIGKPMDNASIILLDEANQLVPMGALGEICISGIGLARGYLNRPELTSAKFIAHPFVSGERLYKTGDLGCWRSDGNLEFHGRIDEQVKIRGYRVEIGEIEALIRQCPGVESAVVTARRLNKPEKELIAHFTGIASVAEIKLFLSAKLPAYMVPVYFMSMDILPLNSSGKIDRQKLPLPNTQEEAILNGFKPYDEKSAAFLSIWSEVLQLDPDRVRAEDDFFEQGGHSIKVIRLVQNLRARFDLDLEIKEVFLTPQFNNLLQRITNKISDERRLVPVVAPRVSYPLTAAQKRMWVLSRF